jgi:hypothetical protein
LNPNRAEAVVLFSQNRTNSEESTQEIPEFLISPDRPTGKVAVLFATGFSKIGGGGMLNPPRVVDFERSFVCIERSN